MDIEDVLRLTARATVAQMLQRDDFSKRYTEGHPISVTELLYPLLQGWDSVMVEADVELGGSDQLWNFLVARDLQEQEGQEAQVVLTMPLLVGLDGAQKMSKSLGNYVGIAEAPAEQFGKLMSVPDALMKQYFELATAWPLERAQEVEHALEQGELKPVDAKRLLARSVVDLYHGEGAGEAAEAEFDRVFRTRAAPTTIDATVRMEAPTMRVATLLHKAFPEMVPSNKEGRRKIVQGGVRIGGEKIEDPDLEVDASDVEGKVLQLGRRNWAVIER
jgi:tyrosyl-tRNA synthetase